MSNYNPHRKAFQVGGLYTISIADDGKWQIRNKRTRYMIAEGEGAQQTWEDARELVNIHTSLQGLTR